MCFDKLIGLKNTEDTYPDAIYFLDDVGINLDNVESINDQNYENGEQFFNEKKRFAAQEIAQEVNAHFTKYQTRSTIAANQKVGFEQPTRKIIPAVAGKKRGIYIDFCQSNAFVDVFISSLSLTLNHNLPVNVQIYDVQQSKVLHTVAVTPIPNERVSVRVDKLFAAGKENLQLAFLVTGGYDTVSTFVDSKGCASCGVIKCTTRHFSANAVVIDNAAAVTRANLKNTNETGGLSVEYSIQCATTAWMCGQSNLIALPLLYKIAALIAHHAFYSSTRMNDATTIDADTWNARVQHYESKYSESLKTSLGAMKIPKDECWKCNDRFRTVTML